MRQEKTMRMKNRLFLVPLLLAACSEEYAAEKRAPGETTTTAATQSNAQRDVDHLAAVRKALNDAGDLSAEAKNVTVTALDGKVTLRGNVSSEAERSRVEAIAKTVPGTTSVDNQLEVEPR
jgi:osmotically-inducible protein OsmY